MGRSNQAIGRQHGQYVEKQGQKYFSGKRYVFHKNLHILYV
jgi:hypothetical protein